MPPRPGRLLSHVPPQSHTRACQLDSGCHLLREGFLTDSGSCSLPAVSGPQGLCLTLPQVWCRRVWQTLLSIPSWPCPDLGPALRQGVQGPKCGFLCRDAFHQDPLLWAQGHSCSSGATRHPLSMLLGLHLPPGPPATAASVGGPKGPQVMADVSPSEQCLGQHMSCLLCRGHSGPFSKTNRTSLSAVSTRGP